MGILTQKEHAESINGLKLKINLHNITLPLIYDIRYFHQLQAEESRNSE